MILFSLQRLQYGAILPIVSVPTMQSHVPQAGQKTFTMSCDKHNHRPFLCMAEDAGFEPTEDLNLDGLANRSDTVTAILQIGRPALCACISEFHAIRRSLSTIFDIPGVGSELQKALCPQSRLSGCQNHNI